MFAQFKQKTEMEETVNNATDGTLCAGVFLIQQLNANTSTNATSKKNKIGPCQSDSTSASGQMLKDGQQTVGLKEPNTTAVERQEQQFPIGLAINNFFFFVC